MIKNLIFDFGGVLVNLNKDICVAEFKKINAELSKKVEEFEKCHCQEELYINQSDTSLHSMKMKGEVFSKINLDQEFEDADLLDYLGYERIICTKKNNK